MSNRKKFDYRWIGWFGLGVVVVGFLVALLASTILGSDYAALAVLAVIACGVIFQVRQSKREKQRAAELRLLWRRKIEQIADDLVTDPKGWSLDTVLECLDEPEWQEIYDELNKLPAGKRSLQKAIEICDRDARSTSSAQRGSA